MGGLFGVVAKDDCATDLFYGTDYHSHLGTMRGGLAVRGPERIERTIHDITTSQFRSKFADDIRTMHGRMGIGVISDTDDQPLIIASHLGTYAIVTVGKIANADALARDAFSRKATHFSEMGGGDISPTELVATLINRGSSFEEGIAIAQEAVEGSCSLLLLTEKGIYAARDALGRTPLIVGEKDGARAVTLETCALPNLGYRELHRLGPGEVVRVTGEGCETVKPPGERMQICSFLWVYYGYPAARSSGSTTAIPRRATRASTSRSRGTAAARRSRGRTTWRSTRSAASPTPGPATPSATRTRRRSPCSGPS
jgi:amidophosphoribosyltransferase